MKHTKLFLSLLTLLTFNIGNICSETYVLDFTQKSASSASYTNSWNWTTTDGKYTLTNAANNNGQWTYVKFGGKGGNNANASKTSNSSIVTPKFANATNKLVVTSNNATSNISNFTLKTMVLTVAKDDKFADVIDEVSTTILSNTIEFSPNENKEWLANSYYRLTINWTITGKSNVGLQIEKLTFTQETGTKKPTLYLIPKFGKNKGLE